MPQSRIAPYRTPVTEEIKAEGFVNPGYEPANLETFNWVLSKAKDVVGRKADTPKLGPKYVACLADFLRTLQNTPSGRIAWPMGDNNYSEALYGRDIAEKLRDKLQSKGLLSILRMHSPGVSTVYRADPEQFPDWLAFKKSRSVNLVKVRAPSSREYGQLKKGRIIPISKFCRDTVKRLVEEMKTVNDMMEQYPLVGPDGSAWDRCYRLFNGGDETGREWRDLGGRIYGDWQNKKGHERLDFTIGGQPVCEIDIKASYPSLANQLSPEPQVLPADPYQAIGFVVDDSSQRGLAKLLVSALLSKEGAMTRFPKGVKQAFNIPRNLKVKDFLDDIFSSYPFLKDFHMNGLELMYRESELILQSLLTLAERDVPAYPVHDCLICRRSDEAAVVDVLGSKFREQLGGTMTLEIEVKDQEPRILRTH